MEQLVPHDSASVVRCAADCALALPAAAVLDIEGDGQAVENRPLLFEPGAQHGYLRRARCEFRVGFLVVSLNNPFSTLERVGMPCVRGTSDLLPALPPHMHKTIRSFIHSAIDLCRLQHVASRCLRDLHF